ncbi:hypothetical protein BH11PLA2_BH11PLA2_52100 [soil metagenome]
MHYTGDYWRFNPLGRKVRTEVVDARTVKFEHAEREVILQTGSANTLLESHDVAADHAGVLFLDSRYVETLGPGRYAFWKNRSSVKIVRLDRREQRCWKCPGRKS